MRILSLEIENILSLEKVYIPFDENGLVLVSGWNHDTNRANGAGKSAIFNSLSFALYEKMPRKITASEILKVGTKSGFAKCSVMCGEDIWTVKRSRPKGVEFYKNDIKQEITQEEFESFIKLNYSQFLLTIYVPQVNSGQSNRFLAVPDSFKKEFILQLLNLDSFKLIKSNIDILIKTNQTLITTETHKLQAAQSRIEAYEESLIDTASLELSIANLQTTISSTKKEIKEISQILKPDISKYIKVEDGIRVKQASIAQAKAKRSMLHDTHRELNSHINEYDSTQACSECGSSIDSKEARDSHILHQEKTLKKMASIKSQIDDCDEIISNESEMNSLISKIRDKKSQQLEEYQATQLRLNELNSYMRTQQVKLDNNNLKLITNSELMNKISLLREVTSKHNETIASSIRELELYKALSAIYSPTGAQAYVLDSVVDSFNEVIQKYINIISPDMSYTLNSFKETSKGDVVAKFSETLIKRGIEVSVGSLSGGEEKGLSLCVDFALLEVLETQFGMILNPIILDEPYDGLDVTGREMVTDLLEQLAINRQILIVDHSSETQSMFQKVIKVTLKDNTSTVALEN